MAQVSPPLTRDALAGRGFDIGEHTYGVPRLHWWGEPATLVIGRYSSIAEGVQLFLGGNHRLDWVTTYPFSHLAAFPEAAAIEGHPATGGDIRIGSDVWIAADATILSGVTIGDGAAVGAGAVVSHDVPPYTLVAGNPARPIRKRFADEVAAKLLDLRWWDWDEYRVRLAIPHLLSRDMAAFFAFADRSGTPGPLLAPGRRVYDCFMYNGEADVLAVRLHELSAVVDCFVVVEADQTFSGLPREPRFDPADARFAPFLGRIRHIVVRDMPDTTDPWERETWQRNAVLRGLDGAGPDDLVLLSDADEIPRGWAVAFMAADRRSTTFALALALSFYYFNYCNVRGPVATEVSAVATPRRVLDSYTPQELRMGIRQGRIGATVLQRAGWHFSYLFDRAGIQRKIREFSHQEFNTAEFLDGIDVDRLVRERRDMFGDERNIWDVVGEQTLPAYIREQRDRFARFILPGTSAG